MIEIGIGTLLMVLGSVATGSVSAVLWIGDKIDKVGSRLDTRINSLQDEIARVHDDAVSNGLCLERRTQCPCLMQLRDVIRRLDGQQGNRP